MNNGKKTIALFYGGRSGEHEVSLCSAASVFEHLDRQKYKVLPVGIDKNGNWFPAPDAVPVKDTDFGQKLPVVKNGVWVISPSYQDGKLTLSDMSSSGSFTVDCVFPVLHGTNCEDGRLQGLLELCGVPYVGSGVTGSAVGMDKDFTKRILAYAGLPVVPWITISRKQWINDPEKTAEQIAELIGFPCFVKPANSGSSVGIYKIKDRESITASVDKSFAYDTKILIEKGVNCREIEFALLGNDEIICSDPGEIIPNHEFYSYEAKYIDGDGAKLCVPAQIDDGLIKEMADSAVEAYKALGLSGLCRIDLFIDKDTGSRYINEVNTFPGFTSISMYPQLLQHGGISYEQLLDRLIDLAFEKYDEKSKLITDFTSEEA